MDTFRNFLRLCNQLLLLLLLLLQHQVHCNQIQIHKTTEGLLSCRKSEDGEDVTASWYLNGSNLDTISKQYQIPSHDHPSSEGNYTCIPRNEPQNSNATGLLIYRTHPIGDERRNNTYLYLKEGETITIRCPLLVGINTKINATVEWSNTKCSSGHKKVNSSPTNYDNKSLSYVLTDGIAKYCEKTLVYECEVSYRLGVKGATYNPKGVIKVRIYRPPTVSITKIVSRESDEFTCSVNTSIAPPYNFTWFVNGVEESSSINSTSELVLQHPYSGNVNCSVAVSVGDKVVPFNDTGKLTVIAFPESVIIEGATCDTVKILFSDIVSEDAELIVNDEVQSANCTDRHCIISSHVDAQIIVFLRVGDFEGHKVQFTKLNNPCKKEQREVSFIVANGCNEKKVEIYRSQAQEFAKNFTRDIQSTCTTVCYDISITNLHFDCSNDSVTVSFDAKGVQVIAKLEKFCSLSKEFGISNCKIQHPSMQIAIISLGAVIGVLLVVIVIMSAVLILVRYHCRHRNSVNVETPEINNVVSQRIEVQSTSFPHDETVLPNQVPDCLSQSRSKASSGYGSHICRSESETTSRSTMPFYPCNQHCCSCSHYSSCCRSRCHGYTNDTLSNYSSHDRTNGSNNTMLPLSFPPRPTYDSHSQFAIIDGRMFKLIEQDTTSIIQGQPVTQTSYFGMANMANATDHQWRQSHGFITNESVL